MNIAVNPEPQAYIDPLTPDKHDALERSMLVEGCRDALVLRGETLVDGHNRYGICQKHDLPYQTVQNPRFQSIEDVHLWMIDQQLGRRSISSAGLETQRWHDNRRRASCVCVDASALRGRRMP